MTYFILQFLTETIFLFCIIKSFISILLRMFQNFTLSSKSHMNQQLFLNQGLCMVDPVQEFLLINEQNSLMQTIKQKIMTKSSPCQHQTSISVSKSQASFFSTLMFLEDTSNLVNSTIKSKFTLQFEDKILETALLQVKNNCSQDTYQAIIQALQTKKGHDIGSFQKKYENSKKQIENLSGTVLNLRKEKANLQWEINMLRPKCQNLENQRSKLKEKQIQINHKQAILTKTQQALLLRDKSMLQTRKRYQRQQESIRLMKQMLQKHVKQYIQIWNKICKKCESIQCPQNCWRKDTLNKCKDRILEWRKSLAEQQATLQRQEHIVLTISQQFKKLIVEHHKSN